MTLSPDKLYPSKEDLKLLTTDLPRKWCRVVADKLAEKGEQRTKRYISDVMRGYFKNFNVVAAVKEYRKELEDLLTNNQ